MESDSIPDDFGSCGVITINDGGHSMIAVSSSTFVSHANDRCDVGFPYGAKIFFGLNNNNQIFIII